MSDLEREEIRKRLQELAKSEAPRRLSVGADCYSMSPPPEEARYICPACGSKTLYRRGRPFWQPQDQPDPASLERLRQECDVVAAVEWEIPQARELLSQCRRLGLTCDLDESSFCERCRPGARKPKLALVVRYGPAAADHRTEGIENEDLALLIAFLKGEKRHDAGMAGEKPLKKFLPRLQELLGVSVEGP